MNKKNEDTAPVDVVAPVDSIEDKAPKPKFYQLVGANTFVASYLDGPVHKDDTVSSASLKKPGIEAMEALLRVGIFKMLSVLMVVGALLVGSAQASAQETGTNFQYQSKIGWGGAYLQTLPTVFAEVDALFTSIGSATTLTSNLAATTSGKGASLVGVQDTATYFTGATVEAVLAELGLFDTNLGLTTNGNGASMVGVFDTAGYFTGTDVEAVLAEIGLEFTTTMPVIGTPSAGYIPTTTALGTLEMSAYQPADFAGTTDVSNRFISTGNEHDIVTSILTGTNIPGTPANGYRTFCTAAGGAFVEGKIYEYTDGTGWDAGTNVTAGQVVGVVSGDVVVGGTGLTDWQALSNKPNRAVPAAANSLMSADASGDLKDSTIDEADVIALLGVFADQMRNSTDTAQSLADATETVVDLEDVELAGDVTYAAGTTSLATIPVGGTGTYAIVYGATFAAGAGTYNRVAIKVNGVTRTTDEETPDTTNPIVVVGNTMLRLAAGDTVGLYAKQDSGGALNVTAGHMAIQRIQ